MQPENTSNNKPVVWLLAVLVVLAAVFFILKGDFGSNKSGDGDKATGDKETVVTTVDLSKVSGVDRLPAGFPQNIPVNIEALSDSTKVEFMTRGVIQYTVGFLSTKSQKQQYAEYKKFMTDAKYEFREDGTSETLGALYGTLNNDDLSVVVSNQNGRTYVTLTYLDRQ